jgi:hypothetical protein
MSSSSSERPYQTKLRLQREAINEFVDRDSTGIVMEYSKALPNREIYIKSRCYLLDISATEIEPGRHMILKFIPKYLLRKGMFYKSPTEFLQYFRTARSFTVCHEHHFNNCLICCHTRRMRNLHDLNATWRNYWLEKFKLYEKYLKVKID